MSDLLMQSYDSFTTWFWLTVAMWDSGAMWTMGELVRSAPERN